MFDDGMPLTALGDPVFDLATMGFGESPATAPGDVATMGPASVLLYGDGFGAIALAQTKTTPELEKQLEQLPALVGTGALSGAPVRSVTTPLGGVYVWQLGDTTLMAGGMVPAADLEAFVQSVALTWTPAGRRTSRTERAEPGREQARLPQHTCADASRSSRPTSSPRSSAACGRWTTWTSACVAATSSASSDRTAPARPRTIRMIFGLIYPTCGHVQILDHRVPGQRQEALRHVGGFVDNPAFYPHERAPQSPPLGAHDRPRERGPHLGGAGHRRRCAIAPATRWAATATA